MLGLIIFNRESTYSRFLQLLQWHFRLGHIGFSNVRLLVRTGKLPVKNPKSVANGDKVKCESCQFGKFSSQSTKNQTVVKDKYKEMEPKKNYLVPDQRFSVDHFQYSLPGIFYN